MSLEFSTSIPIAQYLDTRENRMLVMDLKAEDYNDAMAKAEEAWSKELGVDTWELIRNETEMKVSRVYHIHVPKNPHDQLADDFSPTHYIDSLIKTLFD